MSYPEDWAASTVGGLADVVRGVTFKKADASRESVPNGIGVLRAGNILAEGRLDFGDLVFVPSSSVKEQQLIRRDDIVLAMSSGSISVVGKTAPVESPPPFRVAFGAFCGLVRPRDASRAPWLRWFFQTQEYRRTVSALAKGVNINNLKPRDLEALEIGVPPLDQQRRIVEKIEALTAKSRRAKEALDAIPPLLERFRQSVLAAAFRGDLTRDWREQHPDVEPADQLLARIRKERRRRWEEAELEKMRAKGKAPKDDRWKAKYKEPEPVDTEGLPELPRGWCWASLEGLTDPARVIRYGILKPGPETAGGVRYVKVKHLRGDRIVSATELPRTTQAISDQFAGAVLGHGDLLLSIRGTFGRVALVEAEHAGANITQDSARVAPMPGVNRDYLAACLRAPQVQGYFASIAKGVAVRGINIRDVRPTAIPLPSGAEQIALADTTSKFLGTAEHFDAAVSAGRARIPEAEASILAIAFRGRLVQPE